MLGIPRRAAGNDQGSVTILFMAVAIGMISLTGLIVDVGSQIDNFRRANELAMEVGRAAAQCVDVNNYLATGQAAVTQAEANTCAVPYIHVLQVGDSLGPNDGPALPKGYSIAYVATPINGNEIQVSVTITRPVIFASLDGAGLTATATGNATVKLTTGVTDSGG